eukprot:TRINITY_DN3953_c0_g1_i1.p3 TRINITY_DN3953_c0_g1~~TRINITY_DN3953_c0_g1_i1.p3  ORF type:complete len:51 (+),score=6.37 TRINITY_DN3953_c0_g1_i1:60-212(+)
MEYDLDESAKYSFHALLAPSPRDLAFLDYCDLLARKGTKFWNNKRIIQKE